MKFSVSWPGSIALRLALPFIISVAMGTVLFLPAYLANRKISSGMKKASKAPGLQISLLHLVQNQTSSLEVVSADWMEENTIPTLRLTLKNNSPDQVLTAFAIAGRDPNSWGGVEFLFSESPASVIKPGALFTKDFGWKDLTQPIIIKCAIFGESSFEGDSRQASNFINERFGTKILLAKVLPELQSLRETTDGNELVSKVLAISDRVGSLPNPTEEDLLPCLDKLVEPPNRLGTIEGQVEMGFRYGKQYVLERLKSVIEDRQRLIRNGFGGNQADREENANLFFKTQIERSIRRFEGMKNAR